MKFEVDIDKLIKFDININHYLFLQFVYNQNYKLLSKYIDINLKFFTKDDIDYLMSIELLELVDENKDYLLSNFKVTNKFIDIFMEYEPEEIKSSGSNVEDWIDEWYNLWPKGIKSGGYPVKSGVKGCLMKMKKFIKEYPNYNKDIIMKATSDYIDYSRMNNYRFMQLAHYYIYKNNISTLASNCELIEEGGNDLEIDKFSKSLN